VTSPRNAQLLQICQYVATRDDGSRVVEALASGSDGFQAVRFERNRIHHADPRIA